MDCKKGEIMRVGYKTKRGTNVKPACIRSTRYNKSMKRADENKIILAERAKKAKEAYNKVGGPTEKNCLPTKLYRSAYKTKKGTYVKASCVKTKKTPEQIARSKRRTKILLRKGTLGKFGYDNLKTLSMKDRHDALARAIEKIGPLVVMRKVNILLVYSRNNPEMKKIYENDKKWIYNNYEVKAF
jgi:hypothetical protein